MSDLGVTHKRSSVVFKGVKKSSGVMETNKEGHLFFTASKENLYTSRKFKAP